jgi:spermidine/putrescine ABC transporter ATP-binding subunit
MSEVQVLDVVKSYGNVKAVDSLDLKIFDGEFIALLGPSGCGKTTLLRLIAGLIKPDQGSILIGGKHVENVPPYERNLAMVFQNYSLFPHMTVFDNVSFALKIRGTLPDETRRRVSKALEMVRLPGYEERYPFQLSGGQQQRVALARAIVYEPEVLLLDEPFGALDRKLRGEMQIEIKTLQRQLGITTIFVTHDQEEALTISHRIAVMYSGRLEQVDTPEGIYERPQSSFVSDFIGVTNLMHGEIIETGAGCAFKTDRGLLLPWVTSLPAGKKANISIRPEKIELVPLSAVEHAALTGEINEKIFLGSVTHYYLKFENGDRLIVIQSASRGQLTGGIIGERVGVRWSPEDVVVLDQ